MIAPRFCAIMCRPNTWLARNVPLRLMSTTRTRSSSDISTDGTLQMTPEETTRMSIVPKSSTTASHKSTSDGGVLHVAGQGQGLASQRRDLLGRLLDLLQAPARSHHIGARLCVTRGDGPANPLVPPTTTATLSSRLNHSFILFPLLRINVTNHPDNRLASSSQGGVMRLAGKVASSGAATRGMEPR